MTHPLVAAARAGLAELADLAKAPDMQRYMKSAMPFRGVPKPARAQLARALLTEHVLPDRATWLAVVRELWHDAGYREERYLAVDLTGHRAYAAWQDPDTLELYQELILSGAIRRVGPILRNHRNAVTPRVHVWATAGDRWLRRSSVSAS